MLDINISLDPVNDGAAFLSKKIIRKDEGSLVIATNGKSKRASLILYPAEGKEEWR